VKKKHFFFGNEKCFSSNEPYFVLQNLLKIFLERVCYIEFANNVYGEKGDNEIYLIELLSQNGGN
jgi:hypothetical protein